MFSRRFLHLAVVLLLAGGAVACQGETAPADDCTACAALATCTNVEGAFSCVCPDDLVGDGTTAGTGCETPSVAPRFTTNTAATFLVGEPGAFFIAASGRPAATITVSGAWPDGVTLVLDDDGSAEVNGAPAAGSAGIYVVHLTADNGVPPAATQTFTLTVHEAPSITGADAATFVVGMAGTFPLTATGFPEDFTFTNTGDALPDGVMLSANGVLSGTPATGTGGTYALTINASNGVGAPATQAFTLTVEEAPSFTSTNATTFTVGTAGSFTVTATGYPAAMQVTNVGDALPDGVTLDESGLLSGTPASGAGGTYALRFALTNSVGAVVEQAFILTVHEAPAITSVAATTFSLGNANEFMVTTTGFPAATFNTGDALPDGVTLDASGVLSGTPATGTGGTYALTLNASNGVGAPATQAFTLTVWKGPFITGLSPTPLVPGTSATITGFGFGETLAANAVAIDVDGTSMPVTITAATSTSITLTVPCLPSASYRFVVTAGGESSNAFSHPIEPTQRTLAVGEKLVLPDAPTSACNELAATGVETKYVLSVFSADTSVNSNAPFKISSDTVNDAPVVEPTPDTRLVAAPLKDTLAEVAHGEVLEAQRGAYETLRRTLGTSATTRTQRSGFMRSSATPPTTRSFQVPDVHSQSLCKNGFTVASATRVYYAGKVAIYEDAQTPAAFKAAQNPTMAANYAKIGDEFNSDFEPIIRTYFGDPLRRDTETDDNGVVIILSTPVLNTNMPNLAGFVATCDLYPNDAGTTNANTMSNFGEVIYVSQPTANDVGFAGNTPQNWYRTIRSTIVHELKHLASYAARVSNGAPSMERPWLEEGTARLAEELWGRQAVDDLPWKSNHGYGSQANPVSLYCDSRSAGFPECDANPLRPASIMTRHFQPLNTMLFGTNARLLSPFGPTPSDNASYFYAVAWSLIRHALDQHAGSEAAFLTALTQSTDTSTTNLTTVAGTDLTTLLGEWSLALAVDDHPDLAAPSPATQFPTWNFRDVYAGLNADFPASYVGPYPLAPTPVTFGPWNGESPTTLRGGGVLWYELSGTQTNPQLVRLQANAGDQPPSALRLAIVRVQ